MKNADMLFWGELLPNTTIGTSISNSGIISILKDAGKNIQIVEEYSWKLGATGKIIHYLKSYFKLLKAFSTHNYKYFYFMLPPSKFGLLKSFFLLPILRLIQPSVIFVAHVHRGDTQLFYRSSSTNKLLLNFAFKYIHRLIVLSPLFKNQLREIGFSKEIEFLRNTSNLETDSQNYMDRLDYSGRYVSITNYIKTKGIIDLVKGFSDKELALLSLDTFGNIFEKETFDIITTIKSKNTTIHGFLIRELFVETIVKFDALILPSWNEGQPTIIIEAMALGIPIIASDVGDVRNMLGEDYPFIFEAKNREGLKDTILKFHHFENKEKLSESLKERYYQFFSNENYKKEVVRIFN